MTKVKSQPVRLIRYRIAINANASALASIMGNRLRSSIGSDGSLGVVR
ncbi:MAG: hypothetical protein LBT74_14050 [Acidobacteriota bacterium]|nr:hypothetical protein [Acidobacteriota bacterium]